MTNATTDSVIGIGILNYPGVLKSASYGFDEMFSIANLISRNMAPAQSSKQFQVHQFNLADIEGAISEQGAEDQWPELHAVIVPPSLQNEYQDMPVTAINPWLRTYHGQGAVICSACAGAFILARTGILQGRSVTTHWALEDRFRQMHPDIDLDVQKILINDGDVMTAAGLMSWVDLGLELVARFMSPVIMRQLGKNMIVDTGLREQRYYQSFSPKLDHGDEAILKAQHYVQQHFNSPLSASDMAAKSILTERTFLRRFVKATGFKPIQYLQRLRIQKACTLLESTGDTVEMIALKVGYEDTSAFRKTFMKIMGLTPREFKNRFAERVVL